MSLICPTCKAENRDGAKRCMICNADLARRPPADSGQQPSPRLCPAGRHTMDPSWKACPYCEADRKSRSEPSPPAPPLPASVPAQVAPPPLPSPPSVPRPPAVARERPILGIGSPVPAGVQAPPLLPVAPAAEPRTRRRGTQFALSPDLAPPPAGPAPAPAAAAPGAAAAVAPAAGGGRRIVGVLVTHTWRGEGQLFAVREGRNFLGSDPECEIALAGDPMLSGRHATILFRGRDFWIDDGNSMNGTFVDGECVEEKQKLRNYARIQTGSTVWSFVAFEPQVGE